MTSPWERWDTHGRPELERLIRRLENAGRRAGRTTTLALPELDVGAAIARAPDLLLIDDLQLWSAPRGDHALRRYQIAERAIEAGINVFATLDVQCLESVNERIARISNVRMRDTVPDSFLELADEIELVDLPPEELIQRLRAGKVHVADHINRSMRRFFSRRNLNALREAAMRITADRLDRAGGWGRGVFRSDTGPYPGVHRRNALGLEIGSNGAPFGGAPAYSLDGALRADPSLPIVGRSVEGTGCAFHENGGTLGRRSHHADGGGPVSRRKSSATPNHAGLPRILVGRSRVGLWQRLLHRSVSDKLLAKTRNAEVTLVMPETPEEREGGVFPDLARGGRTLTGFAVASLAVAGALGVAHILELFMPVPNITLVFLAAVVLVAVRVGLWPSIYASFLSLLVFNFFLTEPYYTLSVTHEEDLLTIAFFLVMATLTGNLASTVRSQVEAIRRSARRIENLYDFSRRVAAAVSLDDTLWAVVSHVASTLGCRSLLLLPGENEALEIVSGYPPEDHLESVEWTAAEKAWKSAQPAGWSQPEDEGGAWLFLPLKTASGPLGLLGVAFEDQNSVLAPEQHRLLDAVADQAAVAIERTQLTTDIEEARILSETEQLRSALLSSVSHDLRTPLVSIIGSSTTLTNFGASLSEDDRRELAHTILDESQRLNRFVQNLLDMTRLGYGVLQPKRDWVELREIVGRGPARSGTRHGRLRGGNKDFRSDADAFRRHGADRPSPGQSARQRVEIHAGGGDVFSSMAISTARTRRFRFPIPAEAFRRPTGRRFSTCFIVSGRATKRRGAPAWGWRSARDWFSPMVVRSKPCRVPTGRVQPSGSWFLSAIFRPFRISWTMAKREAERWRKAHRQKSW